MAIVAHLDVLPNPFAFDDWSIIVENPYMTHPRAIVKMFGGNVWDFLGRVGVGYYYRPMMHVFHYLVYHLLGPQPGWFHLACLLLHAAVSVMVASVVGQISGRRPVGLLAGLLFAVHPIHTEVVAWISCSPELLSSFFSLLTIALYLKSTETNRIGASPKGANATGRVLLAFAMGASLLIAQLSKEIGVMAPLLIVIYEWAVRRRGPIHQLRERAPEYIALAFATVIYLTARIWALGGLAPVHRRGGLPVTEHLWTSLALFYRYLAILFWPLHLNFFRYYLPDRSPLEPAVLAGWLSLAAFLGLGVWLYRRRAPEVLALPMYLLWLLPVFQLPYIFTGLLMFERAAYLPSVGFCWLAAAGLVKIAEGPAEAGRYSGHYRWPVVVLAAVVLAVYTGRSAIRMRDWRDEVQLTREGLARSPGSFHMRLVSGEALLRHDRPAEAAQELRQSIRLLSDYADAHNDLGRAYWASGQPELALPEYRRAAELSMRDGRPDSAARAWSNIGIVYRSLERNREAIAAYQHALQLDPTYAAARNNLGFALLLEGRLEEGARQLRAAISQDPAMSLAHANLGLALAMSGQWDAALQSLVVAERLNPNNPEIEARIGEVYLARGQAGRARRRFLRAIELQPQNARALAGMAALRARQARP